MNDLLRIPTTAETVPVTDDGLRLKRMAMRLWMVRNQIPEWCRPQKRLIEDQPDYGERLG